MAIRYAVANGNWSNTATWDGGVVPTSVDDVFSNNRTITIDVDITAITLRNTSNTSPAITAGGSFVVSGSSGTRNITLSGTSSNVVGVTTGLIGSTGILLLNITATSSAITNINTNLIGGGAGVSTNNPNVTINGNSTVNITGRVGPPSQFVSCIISQSSGATINIVGDMYGGPSGNALSVTQPTTVNAVGTLTGNTTTAVGNAISVGAVSTVTITGNLFGGAGTSAQAIIAGGGGGSTVNITGNLTGSTGEALSDNTQAQTFNITGNVTASSARPAILCQNVGTILTISGNLINTSDVMAVYSLKLRISPTASQTWTFQTSGANRQLLTTNAFTNYPAVSDVRFGVTYSNNGSLTGTARIPDPNSVLFGVLVGPTASGLAISSRAQFITDMGALLAAYNS